MIIGNLLVLFCGLPVSVLICAQTAIYLLNNLSAAFELAQLLFQQQSQFLLLVVGTDLLV